MSFSIPCPHCGATLTSSKPIPAGKSLACPKCKAPFITGEEEPAKPPAAPEPKTEMRRPSRRDEPADDEDRPIRRKRADEGRPSRRNREDDYGDEDNTPRRSSRNSRRDFDDRDEPERDYNDQPSRRPQASVKGKGLAITSMILGIVGIVVALAGGGPFFCSFCCPFLLPIAWIVSGVGAAISVVGLLLGILSRSQGNRGAMAIWGIVLSAIALLLCLTGLIIELVWGATFVAAMEESRQNTQARMEESRQAQAELKNVQQQAKNQPAKKIYTREEFRAIVMGETPEAVTLVLKEPEDRRFQKDEVIWIYRGITTDRITGRTDTSAEVVFKNGKVIRVSFTDGQGAKR